jgi:serine/threonine protein kinase
MEYVQHGDLGKHLTGPWAEIDTQNITIQLLEGLIIMHSLGITHRDLRPEVSSQICALIVLSKYHRQLIPIQNIFVTSLSPIRVKLGDFGISKRVQNNDTALRTSCGAIEYTAPEVYVHGHPEYTNTVDIWSLGCVVHKVLTSQTPFTGPGLWNYAFGPAEFPIDHLKAKGISVSGMEFIQCLMKKDAGSRPSAEQARKSAWLNGVEKTQGARTKYRGCLGWFWKMFHLWGRR